MSDRKIRRKAEKTGKPVVMSVDKLTAVAEKNKSIASFMNMLNEQVYKVHMMTAALDAKAITPDQAISMESIYTIPMFAGLKGADDLLIVDFAAAVFKRYQLSVEVAKGDDTLASFLIDNDKNFYDLFASLGAEEDEKKRQDVFSNAYITSLKNVQKVLTDALSVQMAEVFIHR